MDVISPQLLHVEEDGFQKSIQIQSTRKPGTGLLLIIFPIVFIAFSQSILSSWDKSFGSDIIHSLFVVVFTAVPVFMIFKGLRSLLGSNRLVFDKNTIILESKLFGIPHKRSFNRQSVKNVRYEKEIRRGENGTSVVTFLRFDYGVKTISFAEGIDEAEANETISLLKRG